MDKCDKQPRQHKVNGTNIQHRAALLPDYSVTVPSNRLFHKTPSLLPRGCMWFLFIGTQSPSTAAVGADKRGDARLTVCVCALPRTAHTGMLLIMQQKAWPRRMVHV